MSLGDMTVLVTGASQGIGRATALAFLAAGARVALVARRAEVLVDITAPHGDRALALGCDVTDETAVDAMFAALVARFGRLDVVFNNASATPATTEFSDIALADWRRVLSVNLDGAFLIARGAFRVMRGQTPRGGRIINKRVDFGPRPALRFGWLDSFQAWRDRTDHDHGPRRTTPRHRLLPDRHRQRGLRHDASRGQGRAAGRRHAERGAGHGYGPCGAGRGADGHLPPDVNTQFMTITATKMRFIGRG